MQSNMKIWLGLLILLGGLAFWASRNSNHSDANVKMPLIPAWQEDGSAIKAIDQVVLSQGGEQLVISNMNGEAWQLNDGFYASIDSLAKLMRAFKAARVIEAKTANPDKHAQLDLAEGDLLVSLQQGDEVLNAFYVGKQSNSGLTFVRREGEDQSYTVKGLEPISFNTESWRLKKVLDIAAEEVQTVKIKPIDGDQVLAVRNSETGALELTDIPAGQKLKANAYLEQLFGGLSRLTIDEAVPAENWPDEVSETTQVLEIPVQLSASYQLISGQKIDLKVYHKNEAYFMTIDSVNYPQYQDWVMKIAEYKFKALNRQLTEFIEPISTEKVNQKLDQTIDETNVEQSDG